MLRRDREERGLGPHIPGRTNKDESTMKFIALALALSTSVRGLDYPIGITNCGVFQQIDGKVSFALGEV